MTEEIKYEVKEFEWREEDGRLILRQLVEKEDSYSLGEAEQLRQQWMQQAEQNLEANTEEAIKSREEASEELREKAQELSEALKPLVDQQKLQQALANEKKKRSKK